MLGNGAQMEEVGHRAVFLNDVSDPGLFFTLLFIHHEVSNSLIICPPTMAFCLTKGSSQVFCLDLPPLKEYVTVVESWPILKVLHGLVLGNMNKEKMGSSAHHWLPGGQRYTLGWVQSNVSQLYSYMCVVWMHMYVCAWYTGRGR